jgi:predicted transcriptional regulator
VGYRKLLTNEIEGMLNRWTSHQGVRQIARETGIDRKTVRRYIAAAKSCDVPSDQGLTSESVERVAQYVQARSRRAPSKAWQRLLPYKDKIAAVIETEDRMRLRNVRALLAREGVNVTYWTLRRFALRARMEQGRGASLEAAEPRSPIADRGALGQTMLEPAAAE